MNNLFTFANLLKAYYSCRRNKRRTGQAAAFEVGFERELLRLERELRDRTYSPGRYTCFAVTDPKPREVWAAPFRDRVVHHLLVSRLEPIFEPKFIFHSYACRKGKGAHKAVRYLRRDLARLKRFNPDKRIYYLQTDIDSFYPSVDRNILYALVAKRVRQPDILRLAKKIIFHDPVPGCLVRDRSGILPTIPRRKSLLYAPPGKGLPIGNLTSQFFANVYLNELDQFVKHSLKCRYYYRYMDDLVIVHRDPRQLSAWRGRIAAWLRVRLKLELHPRKQIIQPVDNGINFLGYVTKPDYALSRRRVVSNLKRKLRLLT